MKLKLALLAAAGSVAMLSTAAAQDGSYYGTLGAGWALEEDDVDFDSLGGGDPEDFSADMELDGGLTLFGALGKELGNGLRAEVELSTRDQEISAIPGDGIGFGGFPARDSLGEITTTALMVNVIKDFKIDDAGLLNPFLGIGIGGANVHVEANNLNTATPAMTLADMADENALAVGDDKFVGAIQGLAGLTFDLSEEMAIDLKYRYLKTADVEIAGYVNNDLGGPSLTSLSTELGIHELMAGIRWQWGGAAAPAPAPAPQPAPQPMVEMKTCFDGSRIPADEECPTQQAMDPVMDLEPLVVYFDYDSSSLTPSAVVKIDASVSDAMEGDLSAVTVEGNTDTVGSSSYNNRLSARRAAVVREALVERGISASIITVQALGESNPAVDTGDGVNEPLNRRTEVTFSFE